MIRHIVLFKLDPDLAEAERRARIATFKSEIEPLLGIVPGTRSLRVEADDNHGQVPHWDIALLSEHESWEALDRYQQHPVHQRILREVTTPLSVDRAIVDYQV